MSSIHPSVSVDFCLVLIFTRVGFQIYDGQSSFLDNLSTTEFGSNNSVSEGWFGISIDNLGPDTNFSASGQ